MQADHPREVQERSLERADTLLERARQKIRETLEALGRTSTANTEDLEADWGYGLEEEDEEQEPGKGST